MKVKNAKNVKNVKKLKIKIGASSRTGTIAGANVGALLFVLGIIGAVIFFACGCGE